MSVANQEKNVLVHHFLENSAQRFPDKTALIYGDVRATYEEINTKANAVAQWLLDQGISKGDRVVLLLENSLEYVVSYYGTLKAGAVAVPMSTDIKPGGLSNLLSELEPFAVISSKKFEKIFFPLVTSATNLQATANEQLPTDINHSTFNIQHSTLPFASQLPSCQAAQPPSRPASEPWFIQNSRFIIKNYAGNLDGHALDAVEFDDVVASGNRLLARPEINEDSLAGIVYTSGSTGQPKGVMLSHKNIVSNTKAICEYLHLTENDIQMVVLPFFYVMGKSLLNTHFAVGGTVVINNKFAFPAAVLKEMEKEKVTGFSGVPSTYAYLLHRSPLASYRDRLPSLRYCSQAGGHMARTLKEELKRILPAHTRIYIMYGATEAAARLTYLDPARYGEKIDSIGKAVPGVTMKVLNTEGGELPANKVGELVASGSNIMKGYWNDPEGTRRVLDKHGYYTGDFGYKDQEGFFFVQGRKDDLLKVGGHRINPLEIEDVLLASGLVIEAAVLGIPDDLLGHKLVAIAAPRNGDCRPRDILSHCACKLPKYKVPSNVKIVRALPKSGSGKIDRNKCIEMLASRPAAWQ